MEEKRPALAVVVLALGMLLCFLLAVPGHPARAGFQPAGSQPQIAIDSLALSATAVEPGTVTRTLTLTNVGSGPLHFHVFESAIPLDGPAAVTSAAGALRALEGPVQIDPRIGAELRAVGRVDFFVQMRAQADLSAAHRILDWTERGRYVYETLLAASRAQEPVVRYARTRGLPARTFLVNNAVLIEDGSADDVAWLAARGDVARLRAVRAYPLADAEAAVEAAAPDTVGWNLGELDPNRGLFGTEAARVWQELGVRGGSVVVGIVDTGVNYEHEALVRQYRGNVGDGTFVHDYNWLQPGLIPCGDGSAPCDWSGHGTGAVGLAVGETEDLVEQIGVAPGARWIACQGCDDKDTNTCTEDALMACGDWMIAPTQTDGVTGANPDLRPHIVNNSWGGDGCDPWYLAYVEAWQAAGILPVFAAGNSSLCGGLGDPGDMMPALAAAAHYPSGKNPYAGGPSCHANPPGCDPFLHQVKPNLNAPTYARTAGRNAGYYTTMTGTSASSPHAAGCAALLWSLQPALIGDLGATFTILEQTADRSLLATWNAGDCGRPACAAASPYPNYKYGWGYLDCYAAAGSLIVPWVSTAPVSDTLAPGQSRTVEVTFQCTATSTLPIQPLRGTLRIRHDDPSQDPLSVDLSFLCMATEPVPRWEQSVSINGQPVAHPAGPHDVRPGDTVVVVDRVGATFSETITATLAASWSAELALVSAEAAAGTVTFGPGGDSLAWSLQGIASNSTHLLTTTFQVGSGGWIATSVAESLAVDGAAAQLPATAVELRHVQPPLTLAKAGPAETRAGEQAALFLAVGSDGAVRDLVVMTDTLPAGMTFAGNLTATYGIASQQGNAIYWQSHAGETLAPPLLPALPDRVIVSFDVLLDGGLGQVIRNTAELDWGLGQATAVHDVRIAGPYNYYLPVIFHEPALE